MKAVGDKARMEQLIKKYKQHLYLVESVLCTRPPFITVLLILILSGVNEESHREKSRSEPEKYLTIIVDGMDQNKTNLPHINQVADPEGFHGFQLKPTLLDNVCNCKYALTTLYSNSGL